MTVSACTSYLNLIWIAIIFKRLSVVNTYDGSGSLASFIPITLHSRSIISFLQENITHHTASTEICFKYRYFHVEIRATSALADIYTWGRVPQEWVRVHIYRLGTSLFCFISYLFFFPAILFFWPILLNILQERSNFAHIFPSS